MILGCQQLNPSEKELQFLLGQTNIGHGEFPVFLKKRNQRFLGNVRNLCRPFAPQNCLERFRVKEIGYAETVAFPERIHADIPAVGCVR